MGKDIASMSAEELSRYESELRTKLDDAEQEVKKYSDNIVMAGIPMHIFMLHATGVMWNMNFIGSLSRN